MALTASAYIGKDTAEFSAFRACTTKMVNIIKGDLGIADKLFEESLIPEDVYDEVISSHSSITDKTKARKMLTRVRAKVKVNPRNFNVFCDILEENTFYTELVKKLKDEQKNWIEPPAKGDQRKNSENRKYWFIAIFVLIPLLLIPFYNPAEKIVYILKEHYNQLDEIDLDQHLPKSMNPNRIPFILPTLRSDGNYTDFEDKVNLTKWLDSVESGARLAIIGRPGVGKSTLARHIAKLWSNRLALRQFSILFHICLGKISSPITRLRNLLEEECHDLVDLSDPNLEVDQLVERFEASNGEGAVLILDGFDEYLQPHSKGDYVLKLIKKKTLPKSVLILTSRPRKVDDFRSHFSNIVEVVGFNNVDIDTSLLRLGPPINFVIRDYFNNNPNVRRMCYLPLHMTMIIYLASLKQGTLSSIDSETKIFINFLYLTLEHYSQRHGFSTSLLDDCFDNIDHSFCHLFSTACELAFNTTINQLQTFSSSEIRKTSIPYLKFEELSLFNIKKENRRRGSVDVFYFSHQTFQQFMAACYLVMLPQSKQQEMIINNDFPFLRQFVWKFYFGLVGETKTDQLLQESFSTYVTTRYRQLPSQYYVIDLFPLAYAFETGKTEEQFSHMLDYANITGPGNNYSLHVNIQEAMHLKTFLNIDDIQRVTFSLLKYTVKWTPILEIKLELKIHTSLPDLRLCTKDFQQYGVVFAEIFDAYCTSEVNITDTIILEMEFFELQENLDPQIVFNVLRSAILPEISQVQHLKIQMQEFVISMQHQRLVEIIFGIIPPKSTSSFRLPLLEQVIVGKYSTLNFSEFDPLSEDEINFIMLHNHIEKYLSHYRSSDSFTDLSQLKRLKLQQLLSDVDLERFSNSLKSAVKLEHLDLSHNHLNRPTSLLDCFKHFESLKLLDLSDNVIFLDYIAQGFPFLPRLYMLNLSGNIHDTLSSHFGNNLKFLKALRVLDLSRVHGCVQLLGSGLQTFKKFQLLNLSHCYVIDDHVNESLKLPASVTSLDLSYNVIYKLSTLTQLLRNVRYANVSYNAIHYPISWLLPLFDSGCCWQLERLELVSNYICGEEVELRRFFRIFARLPALRYVDLSNNTIYLSDSHWNKSLQYTFKSGTQQKIVVRLDNSTKLSSRVLQAYSRCACRVADIVENMHNFCFMSILSMYPQFTISDSTMEDELDTIDHKTSAEYIMSRVSENSEYFQEVIHKTNKLLDRHTVIRKIAKVLDKH